MAEPADGQMIFVAVSASRHLRNAYRFLLCAFRRASLGREPPSPTGVAHGTVIASLFSFWAIRKEVAGERPTSRSIRFATPFTVLIIGLLYAGSAQIVKHKCSATTSGQTHEARGLEAEGFAVPDDKSPCAHKLFEGL
jgi:hypothetical protein